MTRMPGTAISFVAASSHAEPYPPAVLESLMPAIAPKDRPGFKVCGKRTRICITCGEHRKIHGPDRQITGHPFAPKPCEQPAMENGCCKMHGGKSLEGIAHPNYQG